MQLGTARIGRYEKAPPLLNALWKDAVEERRSAFSAGPKEQQEQH